MSSSSLNPGSLYARLGGESALRELVDTFYAQVGSTPEAASLLQMHLQGKGVLHAREAQFEFLSGFLGGPPLYFERRQHANIKQMHAHLDMIA